jgi:hypothetical protein
MLGRVRVRETPLVIYSTAVVFLHFLFQGIIKKIICEKSARKLAQRKKLKSSIHTHTHPGDIKKHKLQNFARKIDDTLKFLHTKINPLNFANKFPANSIYLQN